MSQDTLTPGPADAALTRLRNAGYRITEARRLLLTVLAENHAHRSADELAGSRQCRA